MSSNLPASKSETAAAIWRLRQRGNNVSQIANQLGLSYTQVGQVLSEELTLAASEVEDITRRQLLALELARLDELQAANWDQALAGDTRASDICLKVMDKRAKLLGMDQNQTQEATKVQTVVVTGTSENYVEALRSISNRQISTGDTDGSQS